MDLIFRLAEKKARELHFYGNVFCFKINIDTFREKWYYYIRKKKEVEKNGIDEK